MLKQIFNTQIINLLILTKYFCNIILFLNNIAILIQNIIQIFNEI
jgi:hypothetical protein